MSKCQQCGHSDELYCIQAHCMDSYYHERLGGEEYTGYVPDWLDRIVGGGDDVSFIICKHCGQVQGLGVSHGQV
jgi:hypothetical protein